MALPSITWDAVLVVAPELSSVESGRRAGILAIVDRQVVNAALGDAGADAKAYLAAHIATVAARRGAGGPLAAMSADGLSASFAVMASGRSLESTSYGLEYLRILDACPGLRILAAC